MKLALAQINPTTADVPANLRVLETMVRRSAGGVDLIVTSAWALSGWHPLDLARAATFQEAQASALDRLAGVCPEVPVVVGHEEDGAGAVSVMVEGECLLTVSGGCQPQTFRAHGWLVALALSWTDLEQLPAADLTVLCVPEPFRMERPARRLERLGTVARRREEPVAWANLVGGMGEQVFDGGSLVVLPNGELGAHGPRFQEGLLTVDLDSPTPGHVEQSEDIEMLEQALVLGLADFARKSGFTDAVLGLSGGIDSAVVAALAARALGPDSVTALIMPTRFTRDGSTEAAREVAQNLGIRSVMLPIEKLRLVYAEALETLFAGTEPGTAEENVQARIRAALIMAHANKFGSMPLATGNRSELAVGYCTLYGDLAGALAVIGDVPKTVIYRLAEHLNHDERIIPDFVIERPPSAELRPKQTDQDDLPPYEVLDEILALHLDEGMDAEQIVEAGFERARVADVLRRVRRSDFKRRQGPPVLRVCSAEGAWPRLPIAARIEPTLPDEEVTA
ncbi:MAG: NAD(+) synthase [Candidatus Brocadiia bacterium]